MRQKNLKKKKLLKKFMQNKILKLIKSKEKNHKAYKRELYYRLSTALPGEYNYKSLENPNVGSQRRIYILKEASTQGS